MDFRITLLSADARDRNTWKLTEERIGSVIIFND
jgi:hypothetical protein